MNHQHIIILLLILGMNLSSTRALAKKPKHRGDLPKTKGQQSLLPALPSPSGETSNAPSQKQNHPQALAPLPLPSIDFSKLTSQDSLESPKACENSHSIESWIQINFI